MIARMSSDSAVKQISMMRIAIGVSSWLFPRLAGRLFGLDTVNNPQAPYLARLFGARDMALGIGALTTEGESRRRWVLLGAFCDLLDAGAGIMGGREGYLSTGSSVLVTAPAVAGVAVGAAAASSAD